MLLEYVYHEVILLRTDMKTFQAVEEIFLKKKKRYCVRVLQKMSKNTSCRETARNFSSKIR